MTEVCARRAPRDPHPVCNQLRELRRAAKLSLPQAGARSGISPLVIGSYERGDRNPPLARLEALLNCYGYTLVAIPKDFDAVRLPGSLVRELRLIATQLERQAQE